MVHLVGVDADDIAYAGRHLREGNLVAFPTETVYGLGANALDDAAARKVFAVKGRPPTDPLICHVLTVHQAEELWALKDDEKPLVEALSRLWPGPLTVVAAASAQVPMAVTGGSGFVGVRIPDHPVARALIAAARVPICAPSANVFGHVSPTTAQHVVDDLALRDPTLIVIDGGSSSVGIESTVVKIVNSTRVEILRRGIVVPEQVVQALQQSGLGNVTVEVRDTRSKTTAKTETLPQDGPGQLLTHYSPNLPTFLLPPQEVSKLHSTSDPKHVSEWIIEVPEGRTATSSFAVPGNRVVVIDYHDLLKGLSTSARAYRSLAADANPEQAAASTFDCLRWSETIDGAEAVVFPYVTKSGKELGRTNMTEVEKARLAEILEAVEDRLFRAASGTHAVLRIKEA